MNAIRILLAEDLTGLDIERHVVNDRSASESLGETFYLQNVFEYICSHLSLILA